MDLVVLPVTLLVLQVMLKKVSMMPLSQQGGSLVRTAYCLMMMVTAVMMGQAVMVMAWLVQASNQWYHHQYSSSSSSSSQLLGLQLVRLVLQRLAAL
jgi:hypothetical protein